LMILPVRGVTSSASKQFYLVYIRSPHFKG